MDACSDHLSSEHAPSLWLDRDSEGIIEEAVALVSDLDSALVSSCLLGCPEGKKMEFITSLLDALTTDMVQAINSAAPTGGGR